MDGWLDGLLSRELRSGVKIGTLIKFQVKVKAAGEVFNILPMNTYSVINSLYGQNEKRGSKRIVDIFLGRYNLLCP